MADFVIFGEQKRLCFSFLMGVKGKGLFREAETELGVKVRLLSFGLLEKSVFLQRQKQNTMTSITLEYDGRNIAIKKALDLILYLGARIAQPKTKKKNAVDQALMEVERGEIVECSSIDDMFNRLEAAS